MSRITRKQILILLAIAVVVAAAGGWIYTRRPKRVEIATYVPESALGYLEVNDWPRVVELLTSTNGWRAQAPLYKIPESLKYAGKAGWLARLSGGGEAAILARSQFALAVTGLEVRGEEVKPHFAVIVETHSDPAAVKAAAERRLTELAQGAFGQAVRETGEYAGVPFVTWRAAGAEKRIVTSQIEGELILANDDGAMRACIDARLGRAPAIANNFHLKNSRAIVERDGSVFGFVTADGMTRLLRFGAFLISGGAIGKAALAGAVGEVFTEFSTRTADGMAYAASFENGEVVDRYALLFKPELVDSLRTAIKPNAKPLRAFGLLPEQAQNVTVISVENPMKTLEGIETAVSSRVGAAQSFLLHQFVLSAREAFFGIQQGSKADEAIGDEIVSFDLPPSGGPRFAASPDPSQESNRLWLVAARDSALLLAIVEKAMIAGGAVLAREKHNGVEIIHSSDEVRGGAAFIGDFVVLGRRDLLVRLLDLQAEGRRLSAPPPAPPAFLLSLDPAAEDSFRMLATIAGWTGAPSPSVIPRDPAFAISRTSLQERGVFTESRSPFGNFPFFISLAAGAGNGK
ncbi:MAG: hypothetical protein SF339_12100 [Blastocatellia bacterium]|nr:hypothetical protein [Blastocatellia bacterium]